MGRIQNSIEIAKSSWQVLKADKELMVLPILSALATVVTIALFVIPVFASEADLANWEPGTGTYVTFFVMYLVLAYVTIFFNAALVSAANERLGGGDPTVRSALRGAMRRAGKILPWALLSATVSLILRSLEERAGILGRIVISLVGMAWAVVTFLVLPIVVIEGLGVGAAVKKSAELFRRTWGENLAAQVGFGFLGFIAALPGVALGVLSGYTGLFLFAVVGVLWLAGVAIVLATLSGIFQTALYHYAVDGAVPGGYYDNRSFAEAFRSRREERRYR